MRWDEGEGISDGEVEGATTTAEHRNSLCDSQVIADYVSCRSIMAVKWKWDGDGRSER